MQSASAEPDTASPSAGSTAPPLSPVSAEEKIRSPVEPVSTRTWSTSWQVVVPGVQTVTVTNDWLNAPCTGPLSTVKATELTTGWPATAAVELPLSDTVAGPLAAPVRVNVAGKLAATLFGAKVTVTTQVAPGITASGHASATA